MRIFLKITLVFFCCAIAIANAIALDFPTVPSPGRVTDLAYVLSFETNERLSKKLAAYEQKTQHQLAVLIVPTLSGESIESFSLRVANTWKLGLKGVDNGILVTLAIKDRKIRIEVGLGMEPYISNAIAASIITEVMAPAFSRGDFGGGLEAGINELMKFGSEFVVPAPKTESTRKRNG